MEPTLHLLFWKMVLSCFTWAGKVDMIKIMWGFHVNLDCICVSVARIHSSCMHSHKIQLFVFSCGFFLHEENTHNSTMSDLWFVFVHTDRLTYRVQWQTAACLLKLLPPSFKAETPLSPDQLQPNNAVMLQSDTPETLKAWNCADLLTHFGAYKQPHPSLWDAFFRPDRRFPLIHARETSTAIM